MKATAAAPPATATAPIMMAIVLMEIGADSIEGVPIAGVDRYSIAFATSSSTASKACSFGSSNNPIPSEIC